MKRNPKTKDAYTSNQNAQREGSLHESASWFFLRDDVVILEERMETCSHA